MLIVCPSCTTSYLIDPASVGPAGRTVRCARCKVTWFAGGPTSAPAVSAFVDSVIAEAEAQSAENHSTESPSRPAEAAPVPDHEPEGADDFGHDESEPPPSMPTSPPIGPTAHNNDVV